MYSAATQHLLSEALTGQAHTRRRWVISFQNGKWLVRARRVPRFLQYFFSLRPRNAEERWVLLKASRPCRIAFDSRPWDWVKVRDKEQKKVTVFDYANCVKTVVWSDAKNCRKEIDAQRAFAEQGIATIPFIRSDPENRSIQQRLLPRPGGARQSLAPIDDALVEYVTKTAVLDSTSGYLATVTKFMSSDLEREAVRIAGDILHPFTRFPMTLVHADFSAENIVRDEEGRAYLIDFERSFRASGYYDFVYAGLFSRAIPFEAVGDYVSAINDALFDAPPTRRDAVRYALALFLLDSVSYLGQHADREVSQLTLRTIRDAIGVLNG